MGVAQGELFAKEHREFVKSLVGGKCEVCAYLIDYGAQKCFHRSLLAVV